MEKLYKPDGKRLAKNTSFLYMRMLILMIVSLYTSRIIYQSLGDEDFGLNNVVTGVVALFLILKSTMSASTSRFITFELGKQQGNESIALQKVFSTAFSIHVILSGVVFVLAETAGLWMVNRVLIIPQERVITCNVIYQIAILCSIIQICQVPFNALIIAFERMNIYAYVGLADAFAKLVIAFSVRFSVVDKLILLSVLQGLWMMFTFGYYYYYCRHSWRGIVQFSSRPDDTYFKPMLAFAGYGFIGDLAYTLKSHGVAMLIEVFFGLVVNAANAIAYQVNAAINQFGQNFTTAMVPQITKSYSSGNIEGMHKVVMQGGKFTFFLLLYLSLPIMFCTKFVLEFWLGSVPQYAEELTRLVLTLTLVECFTYTIGAAVKAQGDIRNYQIVVSGITLFTFPIAWVAYECGAQPPAALMISVCLSFTTLICRLYFLKHLLGIAPKDYLIQVLLRSASVVTGTVFCTFVFEYVFNIETIEFVDVVQTCIVQTSLLTFFIWLIGLTSSEKHIVGSFIFKFIGNR